MRRHRGLTLLELLLAVGILSGIVLAVAGWIHVTAATAATLGEPLRLKCAADNVMALIEENLLVGDFQSDAETPRWSVEDDVLSISTRAAGVGQVVYMYRLEGFDKPGRLVRIARKPDGESNSRVLLAGVSEWSGVLDKENKELSVTVGFHDGVTFERSFPLR